jgi:hypothetical protein
MVRRVKDIPREESPPRAPQGRGGIWEGRTTEEVATALREVWEKDKDKVEAFMTEDHMKGLKICGDLGTEAAALLKAFVYTFSSCYGVPGEVGTVRGTTFSLKDATGPPRRVPLRRLRGPLREFVRPEIRKMPDTESEKGRY